MLPLLLPPPPPPLSSPPPPLLPLPLSPLLLVERYEHPAQHQR